jgi:hypothetical protein
LLFTGKELGFLLGLAVSSFCYRLTFFLFICPPLAHHFSVTPAHRQPPLYTTNHNVAMTRGKKSHVFVTKAKPKPKQPYVARKEKEMAVPPPL